MSENDFQTSSQSRSLRWFVVLGAILQVLVPTLPSFGIGERIGAQSDEVTTLVTPASWAFSIWGPLFVGSFAFAIYQWLPNKRGDPLLAKLRWSAAGAFLGNAVWALYTQSFGLSAISAVIISFTLVCLLYAYRVFADWEPGFTRAQGWLVVLPLSALAAWLTAATIVNVAASLRFHGVDAGDAAPIVSVAVVVVGGIIAALALVRGQGNPPYALVFLWALAGIYAAGGQRAEMVAVAAVISAVLVFIGTAVGWTRASSSRWLGSSAGQNR